MRDLDETRRLAYALLASRPSERGGTLLATVLNALVHHGSGISRDEAERYLALDVSGMPDWHESAVWLREQIDRITAELDADAST